MIGLLFSLFITLVISLAIFYVVMVIIGVLFGAWEDNEIEKWKEKVKNGEIKFPLD